MTDTASAAPSELAQFEAWWEAERLRTWQEAGCHHHRGPTPSLSWAAGSKPGAWSGWQAARAQPTPPAAIESAVKALVQAAFIEGGVSPERVAQARAETQARESELLALIDNAPPAVVEPLTVQQIWASDEIMSANAMPMDDLLRIVRAVEAAHGIGVKKGESNGLPT